MGEKVYPEELLKAFIACKKASWEDEKKYLQYKELTKAYLKGKADDAIEQGKLIVDLVRATIHLFEVIENGEEKEKKKTKRTKELVSRRRKVQKLGGSDGEQTEEKRTQEVAKQSQD